ncbi:TIGR02099 family protein [Cupriavidus sp. USMAHM13]|uniref:YhdP family protein n=1 Tax=Cupriavidus sp. USMAHM13 TaxID=1389192 RepID=UPI0008A6C9E3|nr:YhdP family protein [Cupriavidus sp. USMAHM13]AOY99297.1 TIGR02099 family protein [Cupriavidus sp. USMAHM13]
MSSRTPPPAERSATGSAAGPHDNAAGLPGGMRALGRLLAEWRAHPLWPGLGRALVRLALVLALLALALGLLIRFVLWPQAGAARQWLEDRASATVAAHVTIGRLDTYWDGWHPAFRAGNLRILDDDGHLLLAAGNIDGALSWHSLFGMDLRFTRVAAQQTDLLVRRTPAGKLLVAGMPVDPSSDRSNDNRFLDWLMSQGRVELDSGKLRWLDDHARLPQLDVGDIRLSVRRDGAHHLLRLEAHSAALSPQPLVVQADIRHEYLHRAGDWRTWYGQASWNVARLQLPVVQRYLSLFQHVADGSFSCDGSIEFRAGAIVRSQARLRASAVDLQLAGAPEPLRLANAQAFLLHRADRQGNHQLTIDTLLWQPPAGESAAAPGGTDASWREGMRKVTVNWATGSKGELRKFSLKAPSLDLNPVRALAGSLPLDSGVLRQLRALQPAGHIDNLDASWSRDHPGLLNRRATGTHYAVQGTLRDVSLRSQPVAQPAGGHIAGLPGFAHLSGNFSFDERQGSARLESTGATLSLPGVFEDPDLPFDQLSGEFRWSRDGGRLQVRTSGVRFANADVAGTVRGSWQAGGESQAGIADLSGELARAQIARIPRYLPLGLPGDTRHYLGGALAGGEAANVKFLLHGDLTHFPFHGAPHDKAGDFRVEVPVQQMRYQIAPHQPAPGGGPAWPLFTDISGQLLFERGALSFVAERGGVQGVPGVVLHNVSGQIADLSDRGHLLLEGAASGPLQSFLRFIAASPLHGWTGHATADARGQGNGELKLKLDLPLTDSSHARIDGQFRLPGNDVVLAPALPPLSGASGTIAFSEKGFQLDNVRGRMLGGEVRASGGSQPDGSVRVVASGNASAAGIREAMAGTALAGLAGRLDGGAGYNAVIGVRDGQTQVQIGSDLAGMALGLPAPLGKSAAAAVPLRFELRPAAGRAEQQEMLLQYGALLNARYLLKRDANDALVVQSGGIGVQQAAPAPASGVSAALALEHFDLDAWRSALGEIGGQGGGQGGSTPAGGPSGYLPERLAVRARTLHVLSRDLDDVTLDISRQDNGWGFQVDSRQIAGALSWRPRAGTPSGALRLRLTRLDIPDAADAGKAADAIATNIDELPAIDLVADHFELRGRDFGKLEMKAQSGNADGEPVWTLEQLKIEQPAATLDGRGSWRLPRRLRGGDEQAARRTQLSFELDIRNAGALLDRMGLPHTLRDGRGKLEGRVGWLGSPLSMDYPSLSGQLSLQLDNGQILAVEPGAARLLGVLSLQGLLRIATLDFRSLSGQGTVFDTISGNGTIANGIGTISDFRLKGSQLNATMTGSADLLRETQDLRVAVVPRINATSTSVAAAFVNPALGIGTLAAQLLFADEFSKAFTQHYHIIGSWANPQIDKVEDNRAPYHKPSDRP